MAAIELTDLSRAFGTVTALSGLSLTVRDGEIYGLLGPNGAGKTTAISIICGLLRPSAGSARVFGIDPSDQPQRIRPLLGVLPQETALYEELTARENLRFYAGLYRIPPKDLARVVADTLAFVGLAERADSLTGTYSGGMKRRAALGRAILHRPRLLILDEPTLGVDVQGQRDIWDKVRRLRDEGTTVLLTTNYMEEAETLCDRLGIMNGGRLIAEGTPDELKALVGHLPEAVERRGPSLGDVFLSLTGRGLRD